MLLTNKAHSVFLLPGKKIWSNLPLNRRIASFGLPSNIVVIMMHTNKKTHTLKVLIFHSNQGGLFRATEGRNESECWKVYFRSSIRVATIKIYLSSS